MQHHSGSLRRNRRQPQAKPACARSSKKPWHQAANPSVHGYRICNKAQYRAQQQHWAAASGDIVGVREVPVRAKVTTGNRPSVNLKASFSFETQLPSPPFETQLTSQSAIPQIPKNISRDIFSRTSFSKGYVYFGLLRRPTAQVGGSLGTTGFGSLRTAQFGSLRTALESSSSSSSSQSSSMTSITETCLFWTEVHMVFPFGWPSSPCSL